MTSTTHNEKIGTNDLIDSITEKCILDVTAIFEQSGISPKREIIIEYIKDSLERLEDERA